MWVLSAALLFFQAASAPSGPPAADLPGLTAEGLKALDARNYTAAAQAFEKAVAADPKDYSAHFNLALAYSFLNRDAAAAAEYRKTLDLRPGLYEAELNLGIIL